MRQAIGLDGLDLRLTDSIEGLKVNPHAPQHSLTISRVSTGVISSITKRKNS